MILSNVNFCAVVVHEKKGFKTINKCQMEMIDVAKYTAKNFQIITRSH